MPLLLAGCAKDEPAAVSPVSGEGPYTHYVALEDARTQVEVLLGNIDNSTRGGRIRNVGEAFSIGGDKATRAGDVPAPEYHIFNFQGGEGFAIASADDRTPPVVCVTDSGTFSTDSPIDNGGAAMMLDAFDTSYRVAAGLPIVVENGMTLNPGEPGYPDQPGWGAPMGGITDWGIDYGNGEVTTHTSNWAFHSAGGTIIPCQWGQYAPYNSMMPMVGNSHCVAGCGAVAVAQVLYHYGYPNRIASYPLDWSVLRQHIIYLRPYEPARDMLGRLFQQLNSPAYLNSSMGVNATGTLPANIAPALRKLGFRSDDIVDYNSNQMIQAIKNDGRPVIVCGFAYRAPLRVIGVKVNYVYEGGHAWVCDRVMTYYRRRDSYVNNKLVATNYDYSNYVHCNWGWDGKWNGYFIPGVFDAPNAVTLPASTRFEGTANYFQYLITMLHNIRR